MAQTQSLSDIKRYLEDPKVGIDEDARQPILRLIEYGLEGKVLGRYWLRKWKSLGRITPEEKISWDGTGMDLILMCLEWKGYIIRVPAK